MALSYGLMEESTSEIGRTANNMEKELLWQSQAKKEMVNGPMERGSNGKMSDDA